MSDEYTGLEQAQDTAFSDVTRHVNDSGVDAAGAWRTVIDTKAGLEAYQGQLRDAIEAVKDEPNIPDFERQSRIDQLKAIAESTRIAHVKKLQGSIADFEQVLIAAQKSDMTPAESGDRVLIRQEIDQLVAAATAGSGGVGSPYRSGQSMLQALTDIVQSDPQRYGAEVLGEYGKIKLQVAGESQFKAALEANVLKLTPGTTPKSKAARAALDELERTKVKGRVAGIDHIAAQRLAAALKPKPVDYSGFRPDTLRPRG